MSWSDTRPNVAGTHSYLAAVRRTDGTRLLAIRLLEKIERRCTISLYNILTHGKLLVRPMIMTLQEAKSIARHLGLTLRKLHSGEYRVNFRDGNETTAYYPDNLEDAVNTAVEMARRRVVGRFSGEGA